MYLRQIQLRKPYDSWNLLLLDFMTMNEQFFYWQKIRDRQGLNFRNEFLVVFKYQPVNYV